MSDKATHDLVIRGGTIVDGTGGAPFVADVAVRGGRIVEIGQIAAKGDEEIEAAGRYVTPGFVDVHTHYDGQVTWENRLMPSSNHGVTTVVMGNCGVGFAPVRQAQHKMAIKLMEGVEDIPDVVMTEGVPWNWETFPEYLDALEQRHTDIDFAAQLPHSPLRVYVMGERGAELEPPTDDDLVKMRALTREAIEAGAIGVTTSRNLAHRFRDGRWAPSVNTEEKELLALAEGLRDAGSGVFQLIPNIAKPSEDEFALIRKLHDVSGRPVSFSLITSSDVIFGSEPYIDGLESAANNDVPIKGQYYPRPIGVLFGLDLSYHPFSLNPSYRAIERLPLAEKVAAMRDPEMRKRLLAESPDDPNPFFTEVVKRTELLFPLGNPPNYNPAPEDSIKCRAERLGIDERTLLYDELMRQDGKAILYCPIGNTAGGRFDAATELFGKPGTILGLGDGGAHYGMICDAAYPTFLLYEYVRNHKVLPIEKAVSMLTQETAWAVGLRDRGVLKVGSKADLNVIDLDRLSISAPSVTRDLPAGGKRLAQGAEGYDATVVSGVITYRYGRPTGELPGRLVRHQRDAVAA